MANGKRKKSGGQKVAEKAKRDATKKLNTYTKLSKSQPKGLNKAQKAKQKDLQKTKKDAQVYIKAANIARDMSYEELQEARSVEMGQRGTAKGATKFAEGMQARAISDLMRAETGRQKGQGTPYVGPGATVVQDDEGNIVRGPQGRVKYQIDPEAYAKRFIPQFTPTQEQLDMGLNIQPGLLTPYQQTNFQWLLGGEGLAPTAGGRIPTDFRQDWRTEQWGDVYDKKTGLWKRADPDKRQAAVAEQLRRYEAGEFNPTVGSVAGDRWTGKGVGVASADQWLPEGWTPPAGSRAAVGAGIQQGAYRRPAPLDWSAIMPTDTPLASQQALVAGKGKYYQPWATRQDTPRGLINYQVPGGAGVDVGYSNPNLGLFDFNNQQNNQQLNNQTNQQVDWSGVPVRGGGDPYSSFEDFNEREYQRMYPGSREMANAAGFSGLSATRLNPAYRDYQQGNVNQMISAGILPAGSTSYGSGDWIRYQGLPDQAEDQTPVIDVTGRELG